MTGRGALVILAPLPLVAASAGWPPLYLPALALMVVAIAATVVDVARAPGAARLSASRHHDDVLSVGARNAIEVRIALQGRAATALVRDESPPAMEPPDPVARLRLPGVLRYDIVPRARGEYRFGRTVVRVPGPWALGYRQTALATGESVPVDADIEAVRSYESLARRGRLQELGIRSQRRSGEGTEFERLRDAVPDDPPRSINWRATARTGRLIAAELIPERAQPVVMCIDHGRLMGVGAGALTKLDHAINAALMLVHVVVRGGDRAGLLSFADRVTAAVAPRSGGAQARRCLEVMRPLRAGETEADYDEAFTFLSRWQRRRALLAIFTDVLDPDQGTALLRQCLRLRGRHLPLVITIRDPAIDEAARRPPESLEAAYSRAVAGGLEADRDDTLRLLRRSGIETIDSDARVLTPRLINRYLELKLRARL